MMAMEAMVILVSSRCSGARKAVALLSIVMLLASSLASGALAQKGNGARTRASAMSGAFCTC